MAPENRIQPPQQNCQNLATFTSMKIVAHLQEKEVGVEASVFLEE